MSFNQLSQNIVKSLIRSLNIAEVVFRIQMEDEKKEFGLFSFEK